jgi:hypothetical protein
MDEKMRFVIRLEESMASLCREFDISRKTGYALSWRGAKARFIP